MTPQKRPKIATLAGSFDEYNRALTSGIRLGAKKFDLDLVYFLTGAEYGSGNLHQSRTSLYTFIEEERVEGLILPTSTLLSYSKWDFVYSLVEHFSNIHIVSAGAKVDGVPSIAIDNKVGMKALVSHLVIQHNCKRLAFISGPLSNPDALLRFESYKEVLEESGIPYDPKLFYEGLFDFQFNTPSTKAAIAYFLKDGLHFDAVVCANDYIAYNAIAELQRLGIKVPDDVSVTGFDDLFLAGSMIPPLSTVTQKPELVGQTAAETISSLMNGQKVASLSILHTSPVFRRSCGCFIDEEHVHDVHTSAKLKRSRFDCTERLGELKADPLYAGKCQLLRFDIDEAFKLFESLICELDKTEFALVLKKFEQRVVADIHRGSPIRLWKDICENYFKHVESFHTLEKKKFLSFCHYASELVESYSKNIIRLDEIKKGAFDYVISRMNSSFVLSSTREMLIQNIYKYLPQLEIEGCMLCLYDRENRDKLNVLCGYTIDENGFTTYRDISFERNSVLPDEIPLLKERADYVVNELYTKDDIPGFIIYNRGEKELKLLEQISIQISSALRQIQYNELIVTHNNELEQIVTKRTGELIQANEKLKKLDSVKNDFIANITHDFRSPLTVILNIADIALQSSKTKETSGDMEMILSSAYRIKDYVDRLLDLAKLDSEITNLAISQCDPAELLAEITAYYKSAVMNAGYELNLTLPDNKILNFYTDKDKLDEIISNILSNAFKFTEPVGGRISIALLEREDEVEIRIKDNGIGIPPNKLQAVFKRFEQLEAGRNTKYGGSGIGLAFAKQLAEHMHGRIWAESEGLGKGACFVVVLPKGNVYNITPAVKVKIDSFREKQRKHMLSYELSWRSEREGIDLYFDSKSEKDASTVKQAIILIIDDEVAIADILRRYLAGEGYNNFVVANSGRMGLEAAYTYHPDLILCDYNMHDMLGKEIHAEIIASPQFRNTPFIFISAVVDQGIINECRKNGAYDYLKKPIQKESLIFAVNFHLKKHYELRKLEERAAEDELTDLYNRREILRLMNHAFLMRRWYDVSLIFFDLDTFKYINESFGHHTGDRVLEKVGEILKNQLRECDFSGRYGGDEFLLLLPDTSAESALQLAESLRAHIEAIQLVDLPKLKLSSSFGVASLFMCAARLSKELGETSVQELYEQVAPDKADWATIKQQKKHVARSMLHYAKEALHLSKQARCESCGFSGQEDMFVKQQCPECGSGNLAPARNKITLACTN